MYYCSQNDLIIHSTVNLQNIHKSVQSTTNGNASFSGRNWFFLPGDVNNTKSSNACNPVLCRLFDMLVFSPVLILFVS